MFRVSLTKPSKLSRLKRRKANTVLPSTRLSLSFPFPCCLRCTVCVEICRPARIMTAEYDLEDTGALFCQVHKPGFKHQTKIFEPSRRYWQSASRNQPRTTHYTAHLFVYPSPAVHITQYTKAQVPCGPCICDLPISVFVC